jgi:archaellum biogenesis ATPase FlaH
MEQKILSALIHNRGAYDKLNYVLSKHEILSDQGAIIYESIAHFYENDSGAGNVDVEWLQQRLARKYEKHADMFVDLVHGMEPVSTENIIEEFLELRKKRVGEKLAGALLGDDSKVAELLQQYQELDDCEDIEEDASVYECMGAEELLQVFSPENVIPIYPKALNEKLGGGLPRGGHMIIFARPEAGKTLTAVNMTAGMAHANRRVQYFGNEDPAKLVLLRIVSRLTGLTREQINADPHAATQLALERGYGNIRFVSMAPGTIADVRKHILEYKPDVVILDQMTNLNHKNLSKTEKFEEIAYRMRMLLKEMDIAGISFCQAGESAEGKLMLDMDDVYFSNTGIAAQADVMVGIGFNSEYASMSRRYLSLPKNKIGGDHEGVPVTIEPSISRMVGI